MTNRRRWLVLLTTGVVLAAAAGWTEPLVKTLDNGAQVIVEENHAAPVVAVRFYVGTGAAFEGKWLGAGISHFVEHCCDKGTPTRTAAEIEDLVQRLGNNANAYTSKRVTCYHITTASKFVGEAIDLLGDYVLGATFPPQEVEIQRGVILREIARGDDDPGRLLYNLFAETMFRTSPQRYRVIGYEEQFKAVTRDELAAYHHERYTPDNLVVAVVGDVKVGEVLEMLARAVGKYPRRAAPSVVIPAEPPPAGVRRRVMERQGLQRAYLMMGFRTVDLFSADMYPLDVASYILSNGATSRLVRQLRDNQGLVDSIWTWSDTPDYAAGSFVIGAVLDPANLERAEASIIEQLDRLKHQKVSAVELRRAKKQKEAELVFARETVEGRAEQLAYDLLLTGDADFSRHYVERIQQVNAEDIRRVARKYFDFDRRVVCILRPPAAPAKRHGKPSKAGGRLVRAVLDNGLRVIIKSDPQVPTVHIATAAEAGLRCETPQTSGITRLMAKMLLRGTTSRTRQQIADAFESRGGSIGAFSGRNSFGITAQVLPADASRALEVVADCLQRPNFPQSELERLRQLTLAAIKAQEDDVDAVASKLLRQTLFTVHPYRNQEIGTAESIKALTREAVKRYWRQVCRPERMVLAVLGNVDAEAAMQQVKALFGGWRPQAVEPVAEPPQEPPIEQRREKTAHRAQQQAIVMYGFIGPRVADPDRYAADVMSAVFAGAGMPGGRLNTALRRRQLVYATYAYAVRGIDPGYYAVYAATPPDKVAQVRGIIEGIIRQLQSEPVSAEELQRAKEMCITSHDISLSHPASLAQSIALDELYGLGYDEITRYSQRIAAVTAGEVQQQARRLLDLDHCAVVVTMPPAD